MNDNLYISLPRPLEVPPVVIGYLGDLIISLVNNHVCAKELNREAVGRDYLRIVWVRIAEKVCLKAKETYNLSTETYDELCKAFLKPNHYYVVS